MLSFDKETIQARLRLPDGKALTRPIEVRRNPITGRTCRITFSRAEEREPGGEGLPQPPPFAADRSDCPFCPAHLATSTPMLIPELCPEGRLRKGRSVLVPNLFPYGSYSAVSLFDEAHFVEIGTASAEAYADSFLNCRDYLGAILAADPDAAFVAITQNHLPSAGGSLVHPHLQVQADRVASNHHRFLAQRSAGHYHLSGRLLFSDYLSHERRDSTRLIGRTGSWEWLAAFAPEGFFEIWGILPGVTSIRRALDEHWRELAQGVINAQRFYRSLGRNGYNLGLLSVEDGAGVLELRAVLIVRSNFAPWARSDHTGFEVMLGEMATFSAPEDTAERARPFWGAQ